MHVMDKRNKYPMSMEWGLNAKANRFKHLTSPSARERRLKKEDPNSRWTKKKSLKSNSNQDQDQIIF